MRITELFLHLLIEIACEYLTSPLSLHLYSYLRIILEYWFYSLIYCDLSPCIFFFTRLYSRSLKYWSPLFVWVQVLLLSFVSVYPNTFSHVSSSCTQVFLVNNLSYSEVALKMNQLHCQVSCNRCIDRNSSLKYQSHQCTTSYLWSPLLIWVQVCLVNNLSLMCP